MAAFGVSRILLIMQDGLLRGAGLLSALVCLHCGGGGAAASGEGGLDDPEAPVEGNAVNSPPNAEHPYIQYFGRWDRVTLGTGNI